MIIFPFYDFHFMEKWLSLLTVKNKNMSKKKEKIDNPFVTTGYVSAEYFCDREKETQDVENLLESSGCKLVTFVLICGCYPYTLDAIGAFGNTIAQHRWLCFLINFLRKKEKKNWQNRINCMALTFMFLWKFAQFKNYEKE